MSRSSPRLADAQVDLNPHQVEADERTQGDHAINFPGIADHRLEAAPEDVLHVLQR